MSVLSDPTVEVLVGFSAAVEELESDLLDADVQPGNGRVATEEAEPSAVEEEEAAELEAAAAVPIVPLIKKRRVQGRYRSAGTGFQLELRIDVDGVRPMRRVSGDFFQTTGGTTGYFGSFVVNAPTITTSLTQIRIEGLGKFTWSAAAPFIRVTIPRVSFFLPPRPATLQFISPPNSPGASYLCPFVSTNFRTIQWEQDSVAGVVPFVSYDTGSLPQPPSSAARVLTVPRAYAEAGLQLQAAGVPNVVPLTEAGADGLWTDSELHNAMVRHFSLFANVPQWRVWLLVATAHVGGYRGIMFDYTGSFQRQGCAVFYNAIKGSDPESQRAQLRTYVHELGHAFNLLHSWQKNLANPPQPLGPNGGLGDLSWMNYVQNYQPPPPAPGGTAAYWADFPFQFTDNELVHLRHGFYRNVIMGGSPFGTGAAEIAPELFDDPVVDNSGLALQLRSKEAFELGEPVVVELKLSTTDIRGRDTHAYLHPRDDFVTIAIRQPSGRTVAYRPLLRRCADENKTIRLGGERPAIYDSAYVGFGKDGFYFDQPGRYALRAQYVATDGSRVVTPVHELVVRPPTSREDLEVAELLMGEQQGQLLYLLGSDSETLQDGNAALDVLLDEHGDHPLAVYARLLKGVNAQRDFKDLTPERELKVRPAKPEESIELLTAVEQASTKDEGVDNITLNLALRTLARAETKAGKPRAATQVLNRMVKIFDEKGLNPLVLNTIREQADTTKQALAEDSK